MAYKVVALADGASCKVRQLGLFELDGKGREVLGPYRYTMLSATGGIIEDTYDLRALDEIPQPPDRPLEEIQPGTDEHFALLEFDTYQAAQAHEKVRIESYHGYAADITAYILTNCLEEADRQRVVTEDDWQAVYHAVLCPELTAEVIAQTLGDVFQGFLRWAGHPGRAFDYGRRERQSRRLATVGA